MKTKETLVDRELLYSLKRKGFDSFNESTTLTLVSKWLREEHLIHVFVAFKPNIKKWDVMPYPMNMNGREYCKYCLMYNLKTERTRRYETYEEALEQGIRESLNMITDVN